MCIQVHIRGMLEYFSCSNTCDLRKKPVDSFVFYFYVAFLGFWFNPDSLNRSFIVLTQN